MSNHKNSKKLRKIDNIGSSGIEIQQSHEGILPPAEDLKILEKLNPGTIDRFLKLAEKDQNFYIENHVSLFTKVLSSTNLGRFIGFFAFIIINFLAGFMVYKGYSGEAVCIVISELIAGLIAFYKKD